MVASEEFALNSENRFFLLETYGNSFLVRVNFFYPLEKGKTISGVNFALLLDRLKIES